MSRAARRISRARRTSVVAVCLLALVIVLASAPGALAVKKGRLTASVVPSGSYMPATYSFADYKCDRNDVVTGYRLTFPAGTITSSAASPDGTVTVAGLTVTVTYSAAISGQNAALPVRLTGIVNPAAGTYNVGSITFLMSPAGTEALATADFTILASPYLLMTIECPDATQTVDFGNVDPGVVSPSKTVTVTVESSNVTTLTRTISGDDVTMGLAVTGAATRVQSAGVTVYTDQYSVTPPYTSPPGVPYSARVIYTATL